MPLETIRGISFDFELAEGCAGGLRLYARDRNTRLVTASVPFGRSEAARLRDALTAWLDTPAPTLDERVAREVMKWPCGASDYAPATNLAQAEAALEHILPKGVEWYAGRSRGAGETTWHVWAYPAHPTDIHGATLPEALCHLALAVARNA